MIYQDRLGTDAWKIEHPTRLFCTANVVEIRGSATEPVRNVRLSGFTIAHTAPTFMEKYEVPSGGDWSLHRNAAVFIDGAKHAYLLRRFILKMIIIPRQARDKHRGN